jgi:hypothetical protein
VYLSHPVRRVREDPIEGAEVTLRVTAVDESSADALADRLSESGIGVVDDRLRFGALRITVAQRRVDDVCSLDGVETVETANTLSIDIDADADRTG